MNKFGLKDEVLKSIKEIGEGCGIERIILFGSRARGDFKPRSDIDLAVEGGSAARFALDVDDDAPTLLKFDVVNLNGPVQAELLEAINTEGVVLYEKV